MVVRVAPAGQGTPLVGWLRLPYLARDNVEQRQLRRAACRRRRRLAPRVDISDSVAPLSSQSPTGRCTRSASTASAATASGHRDGGRAKVPLRYNPCWRSRMHGEGRRRHRLLWARPETRTAARPSPFRDPPGVDARARLRRRRRSLFDLLAWRRADDISFSAGPVYAPSGPSGRSCRSPAPCSCRTTTRSTASDSCPARSSARSRVASPSLEFPVDRNLHSQIPILRRDHRALRSSRCRLRRRRLARHRGDRARRSRCR